MMTPDRKATGRRGEKLAARLLKKKGYRILQRNYSSPYGEIDIIALQKGVLVFIEVKARADAGFGRPELAVSETKRRRISRIALDYVRKKRIEGRDVRFDVVSVLLAPDAEPEIEIFEDAFPLAL